MNPEKAVWPWVEKTEGCWEWRRNRSHDGYGVVWFARRWQKAHRVVYELLVGPIPDGLQIDHLCRNRGCVRPDHLEPVTYLENQRRSPNTFASINSRKTHCPQGHPYDDDNTYLTPRGNNRTCRECRRQRTREWRARRVAS